MKNRRSLIKKSGLLLTLSSLFLFSFTDSNQQGQIEPKNVIVTLNVNTGQIDNRNLAATCNFGQAEGITNEDFTIEVNVGDSITWVGVSSSSPGTDLVNITKIKHAKGKDIFGKDLLPGNKKNISGKVLTRATGEETYKYEISFTVTNNGVKRNGTFHIDPKIQAH
jgi:hypothetical protein